MRRIGTEGSGFQGVQGPKVLHRLARLHKIAIQGATKCNTRCYISYFLTAKRVDARRQAIPANKAPIMRVGQEGSGMVVAVRTKLSILAELPVSKGGMFADRRR